MRHMLESSLISPVEPIEMYSVTFFFVLSILFGENTQPTFWCLLNMCHWLKGGTGQRVRLLGGRSLGDLFPEGLGQTALQKLPARPELLIVLGVFRALAAAVVKDGGHGRRLTSTFLRA